MALDFASYHITRNNATVSYTHLMGVQPGRILSAKLGQGRVSLVINLALILSFTIDLV